MSILDQWKQLDKRLAKPNANVKRLRRRAFRIQKHYLAKLQRREENKRK